MALYYLLSCGALTIGHLGALLPFILSAISGGRVSAFGILAGILLAVFIPLLVISIPSVR